jgi:pimeloyl-ACP methyl ester carboxylesterase
MNFYVGASRFLPPTLARLGLACLAYNRRGHDVLSTRAGRDLEGGAYQLTAEAIADNRYAAEWLRERGQATPIAIGHSNGGVLAVRHVADHPESPALILLSAHRGGRDILQRVSAHGLWGKDKLPAIEAAARALVDAGKGRDLLLLPGWWQVVSAASAVDLFSEVPDILELASKIACPVLYLRGDREPADLYPAEQFSARCGGSCDVEVIADCDHFYNGREDEVAARVADWLAGILQIPAA